MANKPKLIPLLDRVIIDFPTDPDAPIAEIGGIITPDGFKRRAEGDGFPYYTATVVAVGPDVRQLKIGDEIAIPRDRVEKFSIGVHTFWQITEKSAAGIIAP